MNFAVVPLHEVCNITMGQAPDGASYNDRGEGWPLVAGPGDFQGTTVVVKKYTSAASKVSAPGDVILGIRASIGARVWSDRELALGRGVAGLRAGPRLDQRYLWHWLGHSSNALASKGRGATFLQVSRADIAGMEIPLPSTAEQRRIASILDTLEAVVTACERRSALLSDLSASMYRHHFGDPVSNDRGWDRVPFSYIAESRLGKMLDRKRQGVAEVQLYLRNANVRWFKFDLSDLLSMEFTPREREELALRDGDLLICEGGEPGRAAVWRGHRAEVYFQKALHRARPRQEVVSSDFLAWTFYFLSKGGGLKDYITSATISHLTGEKLREVPFILPPKPLQDIWLKGLRKVETLQEESDGAHALAGATLSSVRHRAFTGEL